MSKIATHIRIFNPDPDDDFVAKRTQAIEKIAGSLKEDREVAKIFQWANDVACSLADIQNVPISLADIASKELGEVSPAFVAQGQELQVAVCVVLAALKILEEAPPSATTLSVADVFAGALWSALSFQAPLSELKLEALRVELLAKARQVVLASGEKLRERAVVPDAKFSPPAVFDAASVALSFNNGTAATIQALRRNAVLDREEIDLLWWVQADWSKLLRERFSNCGNSAAAAIASGIELGSMLRRTPSEVHSHLATRNVANEQALSLVEVIDTLGEYRSRLAAVHGSNTHLKAARAVFPLLYAMSNQFVADDSSLKKRALSDWAVRALLESASLHVVAQLPEAAV